MPRQSAAEQVVVELHRVFRASAGVVVHESTGHYHRDFEEALACRLPLARVNATLARRFTLASNWTPVGRTRGFARHNGRYTDAHGSRKEMYVRPLRPDARERLADAEDRVEWGAPKEWSAPWRTDELRSLRDLFAELPDCRRDQGKKHRLATVLSLVALARLSGRSGPAAAERYAKGLSQEELAAVGAWRNPRAGKREAPSDSTFCRVMADTDPDALRQVLSRWSAPRAEADAAREEAAARTATRAATPTTRP